MWRSFPYTKRSFVLNMVFIGIIILMTALMVLMTGGDLFFFIPVLALELLLLLILGVSPLLTDHEVQDDVLILRQGWYFQAKIPIHEIIRVVRVPKGPTRTGVFFRLLTSTIYVTARRTDLIEIELRSKQTFGWALGKKADHIIFDVEETGAFIRNLEGNPSFSPVQTDGPEPKFRY